MIRFAARKKLGDFQLDASFDAPAGGITALFGTSGAGKTSVLRALAGLAAPDEGRIEIAGETLFDSARGIDVAPEERAIGFVFQEPRLFPHLTVDQNLHYGEARRRGRNERISYEDIIRVLDIIALLDRRTKSLSGGEKQRVAIGRAMLSQPHVLLLDEPLSSLDEGRKEEVLTCLERLREAFAVPMLYVSHSMGEVARLADHLVVIDGGSVAASGPLSDLLSTPDVPVLSERTDVGVVVECTAGATDPAAHTTWLMFKGGALNASLTAAREGARVRIRVAARDVAVALEPPGAASFQNVLPAVIRAVHERKRGDVLLQLEIGEIRILSAVTPASIAQLGLREGVKVFALLKSVALAG